jgi:hypothetical protein
LKRRCIETRLHAPTTDNTAAACRCGVCVSGISFFFHPQKDMIWFGLVCLVIFYAFYIYLFVFV